MKLRDARNSITSPYLLQHADNPVDWWTWGVDAVEEARRRDVPIFLSVGYSACHWCHVMAHESFEDEAAAAILNEHCVSIKVDREELPDVDAVYMAATTALTGHGGWPMSVWLDHEGRAFYAGTYFPPQPRHGMPAFTQVVQAVSDAWRNRRGELAAAAERIEGAIREQQEAATPTGGAPPTAEQLDEAVEALVRSFDHVRGGFGAAPKFPPTMVLEFLLRHHRRTGDPRSLTMVSATCEAMARGGMYDQLGGGFARYSVDADWVVPHFEKMLYDNALLLRVYLNWWRATGDPLGERVARETADFMLRELAAGGGFAAALDADSVPAEGGQPEEGAFYAWTRADLARVLGEEDGAWAADLLRVTEAGTFEHGASTLQLLRDAEDQRRWDRIRAILLEARETRPRPHRDDKIVASWNGLAIAALAEAAMLLGEPRYLDAALEAADLILAVHLGADPEMGDRLARVSRDGLANTSAPGVLEDYGNVAEGFLALFQVTGDQEWLVLAGVLLDVALGHFRDGAGFFDTADDQSDLVRRPKDATDNASPSGWTAVCGALLTYAAITGSAEHRAAAEAALGVVSIVGVAHPRFMGWGLAVAEALLDGPREVAIVGGSDDPALAELHVAALRAAAPGQVTVVGPVGSEVPLLRDRGLLGDRPTAYVCRGFTCQLPVTDADELAEQLR